MSDNLSIQGTLAETTVPDLFRSIVRSSETVILTLQAIGRVDTIYWLDGRIVSANSSDQDVGLAETLLRSGELTVAQYNHALERLLVQRKIGALLCELGYLEPQELKRAVEKQVNAIVLNAMSYRTGSYTMEFTSEFPEGTVPLPISTDRLILEGVRRIEHWSLISRGVGRLDRILRHVPGADARVFQLELSDEETMVLNYLAEPQSIEQICTHSYLSDFLTLRTVWGLLAVNLIEDAEATVVDEKRAAVESEYELEALVERYNRAFQKIFAAVFQKIGDHVYDFADRTVVHVKEDSRPLLSGMSFVNEARLDFDHLLNNLYSTGATDQFAPVRTLLDQLLSGWVAEVKKEFGRELDDAMAAAVAEIRVK